MVALPAQRSVPAVVAHARLHRFALPDDVEVRRAASGERVLWVPIERIADRTGFHYGGDGWHPYVAALEQRLARPALPYTETVLRTYYDRFRPTTVHEALLDGLGVAPGTLASWPAVDLLLDVWWVTSRQVAATRSKLRSAPDGRLPHSQHRGPASDEHGAVHLRRIVEVYRSIERIGYQPRTLGYVTGYFLQRGPDYRFVVGHGNHRLAALQVLGHEVVPVTLRHGHPPVVAAERARRWTVEGGGLLAAAEVIGVFRRFLAVDPRERARRLGLL